MTQNQSNLHWKLGLAISLVMGNALNLKNCALSQSLPVADRTLSSESSVVTTNLGDGSPTHQIDGGVIRGTNLFHSFQEFNVSEGERVYFSNPTGIANIISRVTGGSRTEILGTIGILGNANLLLINPNGIIFGANARLALNGSFLASTANSLNFDDGNQFVATDSQTSPLLTVGVPIGLQFGQNTGAINVQNSFIAVKPGRTLGLIGSEVTLEGGGLRARGGRIELGSVGSNSLVSLTPILKGWFLGYEGVQNFQDIQLTSAATVDAQQFEKDGGDIQVQGRQVTLADSSQITTQRGESGGNLTVNAAESLLITSTSGLSSDTTTDVDAGLVTINTRRLLVKDQGFVQTQSSSQGESSEPIVIATGKGGDITVNASESIELNQGILSTGTQGFGDAGNILINTQKLSVRDGSEISTFTTGEGKGGNLTVNAVNVELSGISPNGFSSVLLADTTNIGKAGNVIISTNQLVVRDKAEVVVSSSGTGDAGNLQVQARTISLDNEGKLRATSKSGTGGGDIFLQGLKSLTLRRNSEISTSAGGAGNGGDITIGTDLLTALENSNITANAIRGRGGNIRIKTQGLFLSPDSKITATSERGVDGVVEIDRLENPEGALLTLPAEPVNISGLIAQGCSSGVGSIARRGSEFVITGRGGLPPTPKEAFRGDVALADLGKPIEAEATQAKVVAPTNNQNNPESTELVEAQGWVIGSDGEVILTASAPNITPSIPWMKSNSCHG